MEENLFVYGTLRQGVAHPMFRILSEQTISLGTGYFHGKLYDLGPYPAVVPENSGHWRVKGEIYQLLQPEPQLKALDRYEGCAPESPHPHQYHREKCAIEHHDGSGLEAWIYLFQLPLEHAKQIESGDYLNRPS